MHGVGYQIEDTVRRIRCTSARLLDEKSNGIRLVDQPYPALAVAFALITGIEKHATAHKNAVRLGDQRRDPSHVEITLARPLAALQAIIDIELYCLVPMPIIGRVDGKLM